MKKLFMQCDEAQHVCDKNQYKEASFIERLKLTLHLLYCRACQKYTKKNSKLTSLVNNPKVKIYDVEAKEKLKVIFEKELAKHQN